jgi:hypothetical protein
MELHRGLHQSAAAQQTLSPLSWLSRPKTEHRDRDTHVKTHFRTSRSARTGPQGRFRPEPVGRGDALPNRLQLILQKLGVSEEDASRCDRVKTAKAARDFFNAVEGLEPTPMVKAIAKARIETSGKAVGRSIKSAATVLASLVAPNRWELFEAVADISDKRKTDATLLLDDLRDSLMMDEFALAGGLPAKLSVAEGRAVKLLRPPKLDRSICDPGIAHALLEYSPRDGYPPVSAGVLDAGTVWSALCRHVFEMGDREPENGLSRNGYEQRLIQFGERIKRAIANPDQAAIAECERLQRGVAEHRIGRQRRYADQVSRTEMSVRLIRWLNQPLLETTSFADQAKAYVKELAFADWAREAICRGEDIVEPWNNFPRRTVF